MTPNRLGSAVFEFPNDLEIVTTREFDAPIDLVFDVMTKPEHVRRWFAPSGCEVTKCSIDLRVGGSYHIVFVTVDGTACSFRGTYLDVQPPARTVETWMFGGWPDVEAVESVELHETDGVTTLRMTMSFRDKAGRAHMDRFDGQEESLDKMEDVFDIATGFEQPSPWMTGTFACLRHEARIAADARSCCSFNAAM